MPVRFPNPPMHPDALASERGEAFSCSLNVFFPREQWCLCLGGKITVRIECFPRIWTRFSFRGNQPLSWLLCTFIPVRSVAPESLDSKGYLETQNMSGVLTRIHLLKKKKKYSLQPRKCKRGKGVCVCVYVSVYKVVEKKLWDLWKLRFLISSEVIDCWIWLKQLHPRAEVPRWEGGEHCSRGADLARAACLCW